VALEVGLEVGSFSASAGSAGPTILMRVKAAPQLNRRGDRPTGTRRSSAANRWAGRSTSTTGVPHELAIDLRHTTPVAATSVLGGLRVDYRRAA
jgi:hypothetical protein